MASSLFIVPGSKPWKLELSGKSWDVMVNVGKLYTRNDGFWLYIGFTVPELPAEFANEVCALECYNDNVSYYVKYNVSKFKDEYKIQLNGKEVSLLSVPFYQDALLQYVEYGPNTMLYTTGSALLAGVFGCCFVLGVAKTLGLTSSTV